MILGIDPGIRKLGYAVIDENLNIIDWWILLQDQDSPSRDDQFKRLLQIYNFFEKLIKTYPIKKVGIEKLYFTYYNQNNAEFVYGVRWALISLFLKNWIKVYEFNPKEIKKAITGNGKAGKKLVQQSITKIYNLADVPEYHDTADALGICFIVRNIDF
jgi:crossover junction endodeoxyribonuclease RuvC